jgi:predicted GIY-YIG superfamily endonuclease
MLTLGQHFLIMVYYVYILQSQTNFSFYKGSTDNLDRRLGEHNAGKVTYSSKFKPWNLVWYTIKANRSQAVILENLSVERTKAFIQKYPIEDDSLSYHVKPVRVQS